MPESNFRPTDQRGNPLITVEELAQKTSLSISCIRERTRENRPNGRGKFIPSVKIGKRIWFIEAEAMQAIMTPKSSTLTATLATVTHVTAAQADPLADLI